MVTLGPWVRLFKAVTKEVSKTATKKMGATVKADVKAAQASIKVDYKSSFKELADDSGLSESWLNKLIGRTHTPDQLSQLMQYMTDAEKTSNLATSTKTFLFKKIATRAKELHDIAEAKYLTQQKTVESILENIIDFMT